MADKEEEENHFEVLTEEDGGDRKRNAAAEAWAKAYRIGLDSIPGEDATREGLKDTPLRAGKAMSFLTQGYRQSANDIIGKALFQSESNGLVLARNIHVMSLCEHHLLPFFGKVHVAYHPRNGRVVGLSKIPRLVQMFARRLQMQERLTMQIGSSLQQELGPLGVAVLMECTHMCMEMRGVEAVGATTRTLYRSGVFEDDPQKWMEFIALIGGGSISSASADNNNNSAYHPQHCLPCNNSETTSPAEMMMTSRTPQTVSSSVSSSSLSSSAKPTQKDVVGTEQSTTKPQQGSSVSSVPPPRRSEPSESFMEAMNYRLYQSCAKEEFQKMSAMVAETVKATSWFQSKKQKQEGLFVLDIGAGNGEFLKTLVAAKCPIRKFVGYEENNVLFAELEEVAASTLRNTEHFLKNETFSVKTEVDDESNGGGCADLVLLSHCLYYNNTSSSSSSKEELLRHALKFVAPGGLLFVFHHWSKGGTLDRLSANLNSGGILHDFKVLRFDLALGHLSPNEKLRVAKYAKLEISNHHKGDTVKARCGCIAIQAYMDKKDKTENRKVNFQALHKNPVAIIATKTVVGIQACLRAATLGLRGCHKKISVVGGGHSAFCYQDNAIAIDMIHWNHVLVDPKEGTVRFGGGANIGAITTACEQYGLVVPLGDRPSVGAGLVLQGGLNHLMRSYGLACDNILGVKYVNPMGNLCTAESLDELFPFKGAGPNFGVVIEIKMKTFKQNAILAQSVHYGLPDTETCEGGTDALLSHYSKTASSLPESLCLDGFLYWSSPDQLAFSTSSFDVNEKKALEHLKLIDEILPAETIQQKQTESPLWCKPSKLFDRELYMTERFLPSKTVKPDQNQTVPTKLRTLKRCLLLPALDIDCASVVMGLVRNAPTKWSYIHFLHGGGAVDAVSPKASAFGPRHWLFAAVITGRFPYDRQDLEAETVRWLEKAVKDLKPFTVGIYGADLGPDDADLARYAFGSNSLKLSKLKRIRDPMNVLSCTCPIAGCATETHHANFCRNDGRFNPPGIVVIFCGRRFAGKDWLADKVRDCLGELLGDTNGNNVLIASISDSTKRAFAAENPAVDAEKLIQDRQYKEKLRPQLLDFYEMKKAENPAFDASCYVQEIEQHLSEKNGNGSILLLTGLRDGLSYARRLAGRPVILVKVHAPEEARLLRGWVPDPLIDESAGECHADQQDASFWDMVYENDHLDLSSSSSPKTVQDWVLQELAPMMLKRCVRFLPDAPSPGVSYKDLVGGILRQPFGLRLTCSLLQQLVARENMSDSIDAIAVPEATGFLWAGGLAANLNVPLVPFRKQGKLPGDISQMKYEGSNISNLGHFGAMKVTDSCPSSSSSPLLEMTEGSIQNDQNILIVDDCLASGATAVAMTRLIQQKGAKVCALVCVAEFKDLEGRDMLRELGVDTFSLMQFDGP